MIEFAKPVYSAFENDGHLALTLTRSGNIGGTVSGFLPGTDPTFPGQAITPVGPLTQLSLPAGKYMISNATGLPGANPDYTAWRFDGGNDWVWSYVIADDVTHTVVYFGYAGLENGSGIWSSQALDAAQPSVQNYSYELTLNAPMTLDFMVRDYYLPDNAGGVALNIQPESVPDGGTTLGLLGLALGGAVAMRLKLGAA